MIAGLILAGGEARRMGGLDKPLLCIGGVTLLDRIAAGLRRQTDRLALSANGDPARFRASGLPVLPDAVRGLGPLAGVLRGLDWAAGEGCDTLLTVPGDTPFIPADLAPCLAPAPSVAASGGRVHHAVALWPISCRDSLRRHLQSGTRSVLGFSTTLPMREVAFAATPVDPFFNINTPADLDLAQSLADLLLHPAPLPSGPPGG